MAGGDGPIPTRLVVTRIRPGRRRRDLATVDIGPRGRALAPMRPTASGLVGVHHAAFSADGQRIAYFALPRAGGQNGGVGIMRADGTGRQVVVPLPRPVLEDPDWGYAPR